MAGIAYGGTGGDAAVSIVVPVYNDERYVRRALRSCLSQTLKDIEVVCVDDGSVDESLGILNEVALSDSRVRVVALGKNGGSHAARLAGVREARGKLVMFLDADDELARNACERVVKEYDREPANVLHFATKVKGGAGVADDVVRDMAAWTAPVAGKLEGRDVLVRTFVDHDYAFNVCGKAFPLEIARKAFELIGPVESDSGEDALEYFALAYVGGSYRGIPRDHLYVYHLADGLSAQTEMTAEQFERTLRVANPVEHIRAFLEREGALEEYRDIYEAHRLDQLRVTLKTWNENVRASERAACLARVLQVWPLDDVVNGVCDLGTDAYRELAPLVGDYELSDEQIWKCGFADGARAARAEMEASGTYKLGRLAGALPRKFLAMRGW